MPSHTRRDIRSTLSTCEDRKRSIEVLQLHKKFINRLQSLCILRFEHQVTSTLVTYSLRHILIYSKRLLSNNFDVSLEINIFEVVQGNYFPSFLISHLLSSVARMSIFPRIRKPDHGIRKRGRTLQLRVSSKIYWLHVKLVIKFSS